MTRAADLFAGAGGFTAGAELAGVRVVWAANHWQAAVELHARNHPRTAHACQDLRQCDFRQVPDIDLLLASPACQGHSNAGRGARGRWGLQFQHHDATRSTALAVVDALEAKRPRWLIVENVVQFRDWQLYPWWLDGLRQLGYQIEEHVLDAAEWGLAQERRRLFIVGELGRRPPSVHSPGLRPAPCASILDEEAEGWKLVSSKSEAEGWKLVSAKSEAVRSRVAAGRAKHGARFISQHVTGHPGRALSRPLPTITGQDQLALVDGRYMRPLTVREQARAQGFSCKYFAGVRTKRDAVRMIGNAVAVPVARSLVEQVVCNG